MENVCGMGSHLLVAEILRVDLLENNQGTDKFKMRDPLYALLLNELLSGVPGGS